MSPRRERAKSRIKQFTQEKRLKENITAVVSGWSVLMGLVVVLDPGSWTTSPSFAVARDVASPMAWGGLFILAGAIPLAVFSRPKDRMVTVWSLRVLTVVYAGFSVTFALSKILYGQGMLTPVAAYLLPAAMCALAAMVYRNSGG